VLYHHDTVTLIAKDSESKKKKSSGGIYYDIIYSLYIEKLVCTSLYPTRRGRNSGSSTPGSPEGRGII
jgi:hypothetical protein